MGLLGIIFFKIKRVLVSIGLICGFVTKGALINCITESQKGAENKAHEQQAYSEAGILAKAFGKHVEGPDKINKVDEGNEI